MQKGTSDITKHQAILSGIPYIVTKKFPWNLHEMLEKVEKDGQEAIVSWMPSGKSFKVHQKEAFAKEIMEQQLQLKKFSSFQRQINLWGFRRLKIGSREEGAYYHPKFIKGHRNLCVEMSRAKRTKSQPAQAPSLPEQASDISPADTTEQLPHSKEELSLQDGDLSTNVSTEVSCKSNLVSAKSGGSAGLQTTTATTPASTVATAEPSQRDNGTLNDGNNLLLLARALQQQASTTQPVASAPIPQTPTVQPVASAPTQKASTNSDISSSLLIEILLRAKGLPIESTPQLQLAPPAPAQLPVQNSLNFDNQGIHALASLLAPLRASSGAATSTASAGPASLVDTNSKPSATALLVAQTNEDLRKAIERKLALDVLLGQL